VLVKEMEDRSRPMGGHVWRSSFNPDPWKPTLAAAGVIPAREKGAEYACACAHAMHALWHFYASVLLGVGENVKALAEYLGHSDPGFTLRVYAHLMPSSEERTRTALVSIFSDSGGGSAEAFPHAERHAECRPSGPERLRRPRGGPGRQNAPSPRKAPQVGGMIASKDYFLPWFLTASIAAAAASGSR
jgi:hypothetical protein